jgi:type IV secretion system protein VirB10
MTGQNDDLRARVAEIENLASGSSKRGSTGKALGVAAASVVALGIGYLVWDTITVPRDPNVGIQSNGVQDFPEDRSARDSLELPRAPDPVFVDRPVVTTQTDSATLARLQELEADLAAARELAQARENETEQERQLREELERERDRFAADIAALRSSAQNDQDRARNSMSQLQEQVATLRRDIRGFRSAAQTEQIERDQAAARTLEKQRKLFQKNLDTQADEAQRRLDAANAIDHLEQDRLRVEAERLAAFRERQERDEARRAALADLERERSKSSMLAVNNGDTEQDIGDTNRELSANESFVRRTVSSVPIARASRISAPHATIPQGTIVQASLETAVDSTLPGPIRGVVAEDVHSLDGSAVLIPAGSKVFGEYSNGIQLGQKRILIVWTRILTPTNRSISIASYGTDQLGRSGTGGAVDTRFGMRFAGAAAISIIGAAPALIANNSNNETTADAIEAVGDDFGSATNSALSQYLTLPPTIYVRQGTLVSIVVDRDLEVF